jgi:tetratricopeptide (TPR) repeat protein
MDLDNPVIQLCSQGARAEFEGRREDAVRLYRQAWESAQDDYEACIAAHYVARFQENPEDSFGWNQEALKRAYQVDFEQVKDFFPSLYLNMGRSYELLGNSDEARRFYDLAAGLGYEHQPE